VNSSVSEPSSQTIIQPNRGFVGLEMLEVWKYRQLVYFFLWRDVLVRYKQTALGVIWVVAQPLAMAITFAVLFGRFGKLPSDGVPYPIYSFCAMLAWQYFATGINQASTSLIANRGMITKVYFPRIIIPLASILPGVVDLLVGLVVFIPVLFWFHLSLKINCLMMIFLIPLLVLATLGPALWLSALVGYYRDFRIVVPFVLQFMMFASPVAYGAKIVPAQYQLLFSLNPMVGIIEGFRWAMLGTPDAPWGTMGISALVSVIVFLSGLFYFKQVEDGLADVV